MKRRDFIKKTALGLSALVVPLTIDAKSKSQSKNYTFKLNYAPHLGMFNASAGDDIVSELNFIADTGFRALEDNEMMKRPLAQQIEIAQVMSDRNIAMGVFVAHTIEWHKPSLVLGAGQARDKFLIEVSQAIDVAKRVGATWITVVPGHVDLSLNWNIQTANVVDCLRMAAQLCELHGLVIVIEPLNYRDHPGMFLKTVQQAFQICNAVNSPSCKILFDVYHQQIEAGDIIATMDDVWAQIGYFQVGDNPGRNEPTSGELNYLNIFRFIHAKGYQGIIGMEHGNSHRGKIGEEKVIKAYQISDNF